LNEYRPTFPTSIIKVVITIIAISGAATENPTYYVTLLLTASISVCIVGNFCVIGITYLMLSLC